MGTGRSGSIKCRTWHCAGDNSNSDASVGRSARCAKNNLTNSCHASHASDLLDFIGAIQFSPSIVDNINYMHIVRTMTRLTLISLDDTVVFPGMPVTLALDAGTDKHIFLMPRHGNKYAKVGVVAEVTERVQLPGRGYAVSLMGLHRGVPGAAQTDADGRLRVSVEDRPDINPAPTVTHELEREYRAVVAEILQLRGDDGRLSGFVRS